MKKIYETLFSLGTHDSYSNNLNKRIRLLNTFCLIWIHIIVFFYSLEMIIGLILESINKSTITFDFFDSKLFFTLLSIVTSLIIILFINKNQQFKWARLLFISVFLISNTHTSLLLTPGHYLEYYLLLASPIAQTLYTKKWYSYLVLTTSFLLFLTPYYFYVVYPIDLINRLLVLEILCVFLVIHLLISYFKESNIKNEKLLALERDKVLSDKMILEGQEAELRELSEFKSHFFVNLSHEIITPLTLIQGYSNQLNFKEFDSENKQKIDVIKEQCLQMQNIINSIMDLSKMDSSDFQLISTPIDVNSFLEKHFINFQTLFAKKDIEFTFNNKTLKTTILIDEDLFSKAITNLLSNALKFTPKNGNVAINTSLNNEFLTINIIDTGIGINQEEIGSVFKRFYQVKNDITKSQGSGIGLAFTNSIINAHQFTIEVESNFGNGTCFTISIPQKFVNSTTHTSIIEPLETTIEINKTPLIKEQPKTTFIKNKQKILVVDDHEQMRKYLKKVLHNYDVTEAENGKEALDILQNKTFDLILTDYMMPVMDGETFVKHLKQQQDKTPILVLTARTDQQGKLSMLRLGIDAYLQGKLILFLNKLS